MIGKDNVQVLRSSIHIIYEQYTYYSAGGKRELSPFDRMRESAPERAGVWSHENFTPKLIRRHVFILLRSFSLFSVARTVLNPLS